MYEHTSDESCPACRAMRDLESAIDDATLNADENLSSGDRIIALVHALVIGFVSNVNPAQIVPAIVSVLDQVTADLAHGLHAAGFRMPTAMELLTVRAQMHGSQDAGPMASFNGSPDSELDPPNLSRDERRMLSILPRSNKVH